VVKITYNSLRGNLEDELSSWVEQSLMGDAEGATEKAQDQADNNSKALGVLCEKLVDKGVFRLEDIEEICDCYEHLALPNE